MKPMTPILVTVPHAETESELEEQWCTLHPRERAALSPTARGARRRDYVAGRRAATLAATSFGVTPPVFVLGRTGPPRRGQPEIWREHEGDVVRVETATISISHAAMVAVAAVHSQPVGIDLVEVQEFEPGFTAEVFVPGEHERWRRFLPEATEPEVTAIAFAAKEAALKIVGEGLRVPLLEVEVQPCAPIDDGRDARATLLQQGVPPRTFSMRVTSLGALRQVLLWELSPEARS